MSMAALTRRRLLRRWRARCGVGLPLVELPACPASVVGLLPFLGCEGLLLRRLPVQEVAGESGSLPEPAALLMAVMAFCALMRRGRRSPPRTCRRKSPGPGRVRRSGNARWPRASWPRHRRTCRPSSGSSVAGRPRSARMRRRPWRPCRRMPAALHRPRCWRIPRALVRAPFSQRFSPFEVVKKRKLLNQRDPVLKEPVRGRQ